MQYRATYTDITYLISRDILNVHTKYLRVSISTQMLY